MSRVFTLTAADGSVRVLNDRTQGRRVLKGIFGLNMPPFALHTSESPELDGEQLDDVATLARPIHLPMLLTGRTEEEFRERARDLCDIFDPRHGEASLEIAYADGTRKSVTVIKEMGLEGSEKVEEAGVRWWKYNLDLLANDPWWNGPPLSQTWTHSPPVPALPITPRRVSSSTTFELATLHNPGQVESYPLWTITGPNTGILARRRDTGEQFELTGALLAKKTVTVNTRPRFTDVRHSDGADWWEHLAAGSSFWRLPQGETPVDISVFGAEVGSSVRVDYIPRYITCL